MHTDQSRVEDRIHSSYEEAVDRRSRRSSLTYKFHYDGRHSGKSGRKAKHVARVSHRLYRRLVRANNRNGYSPSCIGSPSASSTAEQMRWPTSPGRSRPQPSASATRAVAEVEGGNCSAAYPDFCIPPPPPDLDCDEVNGQNFTVLAPTCMASTAMVMPWCTRRALGDDEGVACYS
jgi:hypothetical protein